MREIKFRVWHKELKDMTYSKDAFSLTSFLGKIEYYSSMYSELMQFTGLKDCKGKEIYEGDIVSGSSVVGFEKGMFIPSYDFGQQERWEDVEDWNIRATVDGNIYENPELMETE